MFSDFPGGHYDPNFPLYTHCVVVNVVHFLCGTACLCRPLMDQAIDQIDEATEQIKEIQPQLRNLNLDLFGDHIQQALLIMYSEPDQWRIRALRIVMGKLMAVCFPLILEKCSCSWESGWRQGVDFLRMRVVADHKWLYQAGWCVRNEAIMKGNESMEVGWVRYRPKGWKPSDDLLFPEDDFDNLPDQPSPFSAPSHTHCRKEDVQGHPHNRPKQPRHTYSEQSDRLQKRKEQAMFDFRCQVDHHHNQRRISTVCSVQPPRRRPLHSGRRTESARLQW